MYLWGVTLSLEGSEECLFGTENLDSGGGVFGQVGQGSTIHQRHTASIETRGRTRER
jgi:hypothetical protein